MIDLPEDIIREGKSIKNKLLNLADGQTAQVVYLCSASHEEGTTSIALALSTILAQHSNLRTLLFDCNVKNPTISTLFQGLKEEGEEVGQFHVGPSNVEKLFIAVQNRNASLNNIVTDMLSLIDRCKKDFDVILIDGSPLDEVSDLSALRNIFDGIVMVIEFEKNRADVLRKVVSELESSGIRILGAILNRNKRLIPDFIYKKL